jgi:hypothetical protein
MKFVRYVTYLFYSYYSKSARRNVAYLSSILLVTAAVYIHILIFALLFNLNDHLPISLKESKLSRYLKLLLLMSPIFFLLYFGVKEKKLDELKESLGYKHWDNEFNHRLLLFIYLFLAFAALMILAIVRRS